jgi:hypothetical protein
MKTGQALQGRRIWWSGGVFRPHGDTATSTSKILIKKKSQTESQHDERVVLIPVSWSSKACHT